MMNGRDRPAGRLAPTAATTLRRSCADADARYERRLRTWAADKRVLRAVEPLPDASFRLHREAWL